MMSERKPETITRIMRAPAPHISFTLGPPFNNSRGRVNKISDHIKKDKTVITKEKLCHEIAATLQILECQPSAKDERLLLLRLNTKWEN